MTSSLRIGILGVCERFLDDFTKLDFSAYLSPRSSLHCREVNLLYLIMSGGHLSKDFFQLIRAIGESKY